MDEIQTMYSVPDSDPNEDEEMEIIALHIFSLFAFHCLWYFLCAHLQICHFKSTKLQFVITQPILDGFPSNFVDNSFIMYTKYMNTK